MAYSDFNGGYNLHTETPLVFRKLTTQGGTNRLKLNDIALPKFTPIADSLVAEKSVCTIFRSVQASPPVSTQVYLLTDQFEFQAVKSLSSGTIRTRAKRSQLEDSRTTFAWRQRNSFKSNSDLSSLFHLTIVYHFQMPINLQ